MSSRFRGRILCVLLLLIGLVNIPSAFAQDDILDSIEAELRAEEEKKKAAEKASKNEAKYKANYASSKAKGDALIRAKKYGEAIEAFEEAKKWGPLETYPDEQIAKAKELKEKAEEEEKAAAIEAEYKGLISKADAYLNGKKFDEAIAAYENAAKVKEGDSYATDQIAKAKKQKEAYIEEQKKKEELAEKQAKFEEAMASGDDLMKSKNYEGAIEFYTKAQEFKPNDSEPKARIANATRLFEEAKKAETQAKIDAEYQEQMDKAEDLIKSKDFENAILAYEAAQKIKPNETLPKTKIAEANKLKADQSAAETRAKYDDVIKEADALLKSSEFDQAKAKYEEASAIFTHEIYPKTKIKECDELKVSAQKAELKAQYDALVKEADDLLKAKSFDAAIAKYKESEEIMPHEQHPKTMIAAAEKEKKELAQAEIQSSYDGLIVAGEELLKGKDYTAAIAKFEEAGKVIPHNTHHKELIEQSKKLMKDEAAAKVQEQFNALMTEAEELIKKEEFDAGIAKLNEAHNILPGESKTTELIAEAQRLKADKEKAEVSAKYDEKIIEGEGLLNEEKFEEAIAVFTTAKSIMPSNDKASILIEKAQKLKAEKDQREAQELALKEKDEQFDALMFEATALKSEKSYETALQKVTAALAIFPDEKVALKELDDLKKLKLAADKELKEQEELAAKEEQITILLAESKGLMEAEDFNGARQKTNKALELIPKHVAATEQMALIASTEKEVQLRAAENAKEKAEREKVEAEKQAKIDKLVSEGDKLKDAAKLIEAKAKYEEVLAFSPDDVKANAGLTAIATMEAELLAAEEAQKKAEADQLAQKEAEQKAKEDQVLVLLAESKGLMEAEDFEGARSKSNEALKLIPKHPAATEQLGLIDSAEKESKLRAAENAKEKAEREKAEAEKQAKIDKLLAESDKLKEQEKMAEAKLKYEEILGISSDNTEATAGLAAIAAYEADLIAKAEAEKKAEADKLAQEQAEQKAKENQVGQLLSDADDFINQNKFKEAKEKVNNSLTIIPKNEASLSKLTQIEDKEKTFKERAETIKNLEKEANSLKDKKEYEASKTKFKEILTLDSQNANATKEVAALDALISEKLAAEKAKQSAEEAEREKAEREAKIAEYISLGDKSLKKKELKEAQSNFQSALDLDAENELALSKYKMVTEQIAEQEKEQLAQAEEEKRKQEADARAKRDSEKKAKIDGLMTEADAAIDGKDYSAALIKLNAILAIDGSVALASSKLASVKEKADLQEKQRLADEKAKLAAAEANAKNKEEKDRNNQIRSYLSIGDQLTASKKYDEAIESYGKVIDIDPENSEASDRIEKAKNLKTQETERMKALAALEKEEIIATNLREAKAQVIRNNYLEAEKRYKKVISIDEQNTAALTGLEEIKDKLAAAKAEQEAAAEKERLLAEQRARVQEFIDAGDDLYAGGQYDKAIAKYKEGLEIDPISYDLKQAIHEAIEMEHRVKQMRIAMTHHKPRPKPQGFKTEMIDENLKERTDIRKFQNELGKKYPPGVTEESRKEKRKTITTRFVVKEKVGTEFNRVHHDWGGLYYFKNGVPVTNFIWDLETRDPSNKPN